MSPQERARPVNARWRCYVEMLRPQPGRWLYDYFGAFWFGFLGDCVDSTARVLDGSIEPLKQGDVSPDPADVFVVATAVTAIFHWVNVALHSARVAGRGGVPA